MVALEIDGQPVSVPDGTTILSACATVGIEIPTLCFLETLRPANVCRLCVVEVEGARVLAPSCSRAVEPGMKVHSDSARVRHSRKLVLELLASSVDLSATIIKRQFRRGGGDVRAALHQRGDVARLEVTRRKCAHGGSPERLRLRRQGAGVGETVRPDMNEAPWPDDGRRQLVVPG